MGISTGLVLIAVGAILEWAVTASTSGINLDTVGVVLMIVGVVGLVLSLVFWSSWGGFGSRRDATTIVREDTTTLRKYGSPQTAPPAAPWAVLTLTPKQSL